MSAAAIGPVKATLLALDVGRLKAVLDPLLALDDGEDGVRAALAAFADSEGIPI
ncbi:MAG: hypothetical protein P0Y66_00095 [Candidatus Kaistia colombiensis]|nr:MAG: hypothetical protein P0Y66_00095 [Kaistia sp.]